MTTELYLPNGSRYAPTIDLQEIRLRESTPKDELEYIIREATASVEADLALEDAGWVNLSARSPDVITPQERITNMRLSRLYSTKDPMGKQAIRLWTDYTFGSGMTSHAPEENTEKVRKSFWESKDNQMVLSARGQRKSSDKLLIDGEIFFAIFLGANGAATIRLIDPLEITEIITNPDDKDDVKFYRRQWTDAQGTPHNDIYRSTTNLKDESTLDLLGAPVSKTQDAVIYHLTYNTTTQRGNPLLLPALVWMKYHTKFLASRVAIMLALAKFAWKQKVKGGQAAVDAVKAQTESMTPEAAAMIVENMGVDTTPIKAESGAKAAYQDGRMLKLQVAAATGIPEQYFGDISIGNLATAKIVELPMMKMFQSYQKVWEDTYKDINELIFTHNKIAEDKQYVDIEFPAIAPEDVSQSADNIVKVLTVLPELATSEDVQQIALMTIGVNDPAEVLDALNKEAKSNPEVALTKVLKQFKEVLSGNGRKE